MQVGSGVAQWCDQNRGNPSHQFKRDGTRQEDGERCCLGGPFLAKL